jgi:1-deoxy-D-xylulose-5-phosphate synthase
VSVLDSINSPKDLQNLSEEGLAALCSDIRSLIIRVVAKNGGHLAPNLGVVELTVALHKVFHTPEDKIVWDVGHQAYIHKILTGRKAAFPTLRLYKGLSGFPKRCESPHDAFGTGHSSTSISAALGYACARDVKGEDYNVVAVIGDGALTGGEALEALNNAGDQHRKLIVVLNDNEMSISKNVGALSEYLSEIRTNPHYTKVKSEAENLLKSIPSIGDKVATAASRLKDSLKYFLVPGMFFEDLGFKYFGPVDGHNIEALVELFEKAKTLEEPVLIHVITKKGKGYVPAEINPNKFHGTGPFELATGKKIVVGNPPQTYTQSFSKSLVELAKDDKDIVAITAAMPDGTGLADFAKKYPTRFFDVAIAEQHGVTLAAGMACGGLKPVVAIYSTFAQRAFDQILHDICIQKLPVVLCFDRAGLVGDDGYTHHGVFDFSYLNMMPNMTIMAPKDENELRHMLYTALHFDGPIAMRYPRGSGLGVDCSEPMHMLPIGKGELLQQGKDVYFWAIGSMVDTALKAAELLKSFSIEAGVVNARFVKPLDEEMLIATAKGANCIVTLEENVIKGGFGEAVLAALNAKHLLQTTKVLNLGIPDYFIPQGDKKLLLRDLHLDPAGIANLVQKELTK